MIRTQTVHKEPWTADRLSEFAAADTPILLSHDGEPNKRHRLIRKLSPECLKAHQAVSRGEYLMKAY